MLISAIKRIFANFKWPSKSQWRQFFRILTKKEKGVFFVLFGLFLGSTIFLSINFYFRNTEVRPDTGGGFVEGVVGQPRFLNPIYASSNDVDRDLVELLFSGLMKFDENGEIVSDLAKELKIEEEGKVYRVYLKENVSWSDYNSPTSQHKITADDVVFTVKTIQNADYKSPLRVNWLGVEIEKISDYEVRFKLKNSYGAFLENLTLKIIPKHIWQDISPQNFPLSIYNLKPVGSGPYKLEDLKQDNLGYINSLSLKINPRYSRGKPYLLEIHFKFFKKERDLIEAAKRGEINGFSLSDAENYNLLKNELFQDYNFSLPRYFAVFFNPEKSKVLADKEVRRALNYGTNKKEVVEKVLNSQAKIVDSPTLPEIYSFSLPTEIYQFDLEKAKSLLDKAGFKETENGVREKIIKKEPAFQFKSDLQVGSKGTEVEELQKCLAKYLDIYPAGEITGSFGQKTKEAVIKFQEKYKEEILKPAGLTEGTGSVGKATRKKLNELCVKSSEERVLLKISLITVNQSIITDVANLLKNQWQVLGVEIDVQAFDDVSILERDIIKPRSYEALLFGEVLGKIPDPFPFWHSIQKKDPGLNLAVYENKEADKLLEDARQTLNGKERKEKLEKFQDILIEDAPCVFLYSPDYIYLVSKEIKGVKEKMITDPSKRFSSIENWYIKTKRTWE